MLENENTQLTEGEDMASTEKAQVKEEHGRSENVVIIPTYNEAGNLKLLIPRILQQGRFDVIVVDDNSPDGTGEVAEQFAEEFPGRVTVLHRMGKLGLGSAYLKGFHCALEMGYQRIFTMDADFSHDPNYLPALRKALDEADVVLGSRYVKGGGTRNWPLGRRLLSRGGSAYARLVLGLPIRDLTGGFKGFRRQVLEALLPELDTMRSNGYVYQIETTYLCSRHGFRIVEVPIVFEDRVIGQSKMNRRIVAEALWVVWALRLNKKAEPTRKEAPPHTQLPLWLVKTVCMAWIGLIIILGWVSLAPRLNAVLAQTSSRQSRPISQLRRVPPQSGKGDAASSAGRLVHSTSLQLQGTDLTPNVPLRFVGSGFLPNEALQVTIQNHAGQTQAQLAPTTADTTGQVDTTDAMPANLAPGTYWLVVKGMSSHSKAQTSFQLHGIVPTVQLDTYTVKPKHDFGFAGSGFLAGELVEVRLETSGHVSTHVLTTVSANAGGNISGRIQMPMLPEGNYSLIFAGQQSQTPAEVGFNIQGFHPWVELSTYAPTAHTRMGFTGKDFAPGEQVLVYLNEQPGPSQHAGQGNAVARVQADSSGQFAVSASWEVPEMSGQNTLIFVGQQSGAVVTASFTIVS
jgi:dolichol-phosphate mannosyltransferase